MSEADETLDLNPETGDSETESDVELEAELEIDEADVDGDDDDDEEIEIRGQRRSAKEVAEILAKADNLQRDYTKDKMALAEEKRELERIKAEAQSLAGQRREALGKIGEAVAAVSDELKELESINWDSVREQYPDQFADLWAAANVKYANLSQEKAKREQYMRGLEDQRDKEEIHELVKAVPELANPETRMEAAKKMQDYSNQFGVEITNSAMGKLVAKAMKDAEDAEKYRQAVARSKSKTRPNSGSNAPEPPRTAKPTSSRSSGLSDDLPVDEWVKRREAQLNKNRRR